MRTTSKINWTWVVAALLGAAGASFAKGDLECSCRLRTHTDVMVNVSCSNVQNGSNEISCLKGEREAASARPPRYVRDGFVPLAGRSMVLFSRTGNTWQDARSACALVGADLLLPRDADTLQRLTKSPLYEMFTEKEAFIGASDLQSEGNFVDTEGNPVDSTLWRDNEPNDAGQNEDCMAWNRGGGANDRACNQAMQYLCEWRLRAEPPAGYTFLGATDSFLLLSADRLPYDAAAAACTAQGAALFVPDTVQHVEALLRYVPIDSGDMLVGVTDRQTEGVFVTGTGRHLSDTEFHEWLPGQPDDGAGASGSEGEDCVVLHSHGFLADVSCEQPQRYICEWLP